MIATPIARKFVKPGDILDDFARVEPYFEDLLSRELDTAEQVERWLLDGSELAACLGEIRTERYVKMTCHTDDTALAEDYLAFVEKVEPQCRRMWHEVNVKYTTSPAARSLPAERYAVLDRSTLAAVELYREENIPLLVEQTKLTQQYQRICGEMTVEFDGKEQTLQQMAVYGENPQRNVREEAWKLTARRRLEDRDRLDDLFDALVALRTEMASNANLPDYRAYAFRAYQRFDYAPEDCVRFHEAIERAVVPAVEAINERRAANLGIDEIRPWDRAVDEHGRPALRPFHGIDELCGQCQEIFCCVDSDLGEQFVDMRTSGFLDLDSRKGKVPGGYQSTYDEGRHPFIFMNAVGLHRDVETLLHEGGHAFHTYATRAEDLYDYRSPPIEFAEVASMTMELLALDHYDVIYAVADHARAKRKQLEGIIRLFPWVATIDAFQHWIYTHPQHTKKDRREAWMEVHRRYSAGVNYDGLEQVEGHLWHHQLHLFEVPFYYIEYGIAQLGAMQIWLNARADRADAIQRYRAALALGGSRPLPELFAAAGAKFDFSYDTIAPLMDAVQGELETLED